MSQRGPPDSPTYPYAASLGFGHLGHRHPGPGWSYFPCE